MTVFRSVDRLRIALVLAVLLLSALPVFATPSNKWRIQCSESAKSAGELVFSFAAKGAAAFEIAVPIAEGTSENGVARVIRDTLRAKLDGAKFKVEVDDGEDVLIKKKGKQPDFDLKLVSNSVEAVRIAIDRE